MFLLLIPTLVLAGCGGSEGDGGRGSGGSAAGGSAGSGGSGAAAGASVTWYRDVLPIAQQQCLGCHTDRGIGSFSMEKYEEVFVNAKAIATAVTNQTMPPWMPADDCQTFTDHRGLTAEQRQLFQDWFDQGAAEGDPADAPPPLGDPPSLEWVDRSIDIGVAYTPQPPLGGADDYVCFVLDPELTQPEDLIGYQVHPDTDQVHHVLMYDVDLAEARARDAETPEPGYSCFGGPAIASSMIGGWVPGSPPLRMPEGVGIRTQAGRGFVVQFHYNTFEPRPDRSSFSFQFSDGPVANPAQFLSFKNGSFAIPPHTQGYTATAEVTAPGNGKIWALIPHMHELGASVDLRLERQGGGSECLIDIPRWDFNWQQFYFYETPVSASTGDQVFMNCVWDNPTDRTVTWGDGTQDEMCIAYMLVTAN